MQRSALAAILAVAVLSWTPVAQASPVEADVLDVRGQQSHAGRAVAVSLHESEGGVEALSVAASAGYLVRWQQDGVYVQCLAGPCEEVSQTAPVEQEPERWPEDADIIGLEAQLLATAGSHQINVVPLDAGGAAMRFSTEHSRWGAVDDVCLTQAGIVGAHPDRPACDGYRESVVGYSKVHLGRVQVYEAEAGHLVLRGNLSLEMRGIALQSEDGTFDTRDERDPGPGGRYARVFGRLVLINATVEISLSEGSGVQWAMERGQATAFDATLTGRAAGLVRFGDKTVDLSAGESVHGNFILNSRAGPSGMPFTLLPHAGAAIPTSPSSSGDWLWWAVAAAGVVPVGLVLAARHPSMEGVEAALRAGRFRRAARLSARILRRDPWHESAQLSHAIALTKSGEPAAAVDGVQAYLEQAEPGDGTLHYVLGMALLELGRAEEARQAMGRAVERTPSLLADVAPELRSPGSEAAYT